MFTEKQIFCYCLLNYFKGDKSKSKPSRTIILAPKQNI